MRTASGYRSGLSLALAAVVAACGSALAQPQAALEAWKTEVGAPDGIVTLTGRSHDGYYRAYVCADFDTASAVVRTVPLTGARGRSPAAQSAALQQALRRQGCRPAVGTFRVVALGTEAEINHGVEAAEFWTALDARSGSISVGLVFDSSPYALRDTPP